MMLNDGYRDDSGDAEEEDHDDDDGDDDDDCEKKVAQSRVSANSFEMLRALISQSNENA